MIYIINKKTVFHNCGSPLHKTIKPNDLIVILVVFIDGCLW